MASGDTQVATLNIKLANSVIPVPPSPTPPWSYVTPESPLTITFYKPPPPAENLLHLSASGQPAGVPAELKPNAWLPVSLGNVTSFFSWNQQNSNIRWNTGSWENPDLSFVGAFTSGPVVGAVSQPATTASQSSSITSGATPSSAVPGQTTASIASATSQPSTSPKSDKNGISSGAVAGAAIGCFIGGVLLTGVIFWFCGRKRRPSRARDFEASSTALMPHEKGFQTAAIPLGSTRSATSPASGALPLPLEDKAITGEISKISSSIKNHVQSYYQMGRVSAGLIDMDDIHALGSNQPISAGTLSTLLGNSATREIALRFCIAWVVCSRMQSSGDSNSTFLPMEIAGFYQKIASEHRNSSAQGSVMLARWRVMTAELMQVSYARNAFSRSDSRSASVQATANALDNVLRPFADSRMDNGERRQNLEEILKRSALFAFTMFSQPSTWDFDWQQEGAFKSGELCIFPSLVQLSDENGQSISPPRAFSEAVVRRLDEQ